jgi:hypothetical protein
MSQTGEDPGAAEDAGEKIPKEAELAEAATQSAEAEGDGQAAEQGPGAEGQGAEGQAGESAAGDAGSADQSGESAEPKAAESQATSA